MDRRAFAAALCGGATFVPGLVSTGASAAAGKPAAPASVEPLRAAQLITAIRAASGLPAVEVDGRMNAAAQRQARAIAASGSLDHGDFSGRVRSFGIRGTAAENLAYGVDDVGSVIALWQGSPAHAANILLPGARRIGIARVGRYWAMVIG